MSDSKPLCAELEDDRRQLKDVLERAEAIVADLNAEQARWKPAPDRWSVAECLDHLIATSRPYLIDLAAKVEKARAKGVLRDREPKRGWLGSWFINSLEPPPKRKFKALQPFVPATGPGIAAVMEEYHSHKKRWDEISVDSIGLDL